MYGTSAHAYVRGHLLHKQLKSALLDGTACDIQNM
jgi:hypothetical protein